MEILGSGEEQWGHIGRLLQASEWVVGGGSFLCTISGSLKPAWISPRKNAHPASEDWQWKMCLLLSEGIWGRAVAMQAGVRAPSRSLFQLFKLSRLPEIKSWMEILVLAVKRSFWMNSASNNECLLSSSSPPTLFLNINISCQLS